MKKNSKRIVKDYSKYSYENPQYYGLLQKKGNIRVDVKRMSKTMYLDDEILAEMNKPRKTVYFIPYKKSDLDYVINIFKKYIADMREMWENEILPIIKLIKTPQEVGEEARTGYFMQTGILDYDECSIHGFMTSIKRESEYFAVIKSLISQFVHQYMSGLESVTIKVLTIKGYKEEAFKRNGFNSFIQGYQAKNSNRDNVLKLEDLDSYKNYDLIYKVWHFLKHNSLDLYKKIKNNYPDMLLQDTDFVNGKLALAVLKIDFDYIEKIFEYSLTFFNELCEKVFNENLFFAKWNSETYFDAIVRDQIDLICNPLGFPGYI